MKKSLVSVIVESAAGVADWQAKNGKKDMQDVADKLQELGNELVNIEAKIKRQPFKHGLHDQNKLLIDERAALMLYIKKYMARVDLFDDAKLFFNPLEITGTMKDATEQDLKRNNPTFEQLKEYFTESTLNSDNARYIFKIMPFYKAYLGSLDNPFGKLIAGLWYADNKLNNN